MALPYAKPVVCPILVGREPHLESLQELSAQASGGRGRMVLVSGEAGVGKSRLLAEIQRRAGKQDFLVLQGHCFEQDISFPYAPLVDLLRTFVMRHPVAETFDLLGPLTGELVKLLPELTQTLNLAPSPALEPEAEKRRLFEALARLFIQLSVSQPLLIILEDIHWSDETSLDFLHVFARRLSDYPILLLASYRREEVSAPLQHLLAQFDRERLAHEVVLESLARSEVDTMLQAIFALELAQAAADREAEWQLLIDLGKLWGSRDYARTGSYFQRALDIARGMDEPSTLARSLNRMGNWHVNIEEPERSLPLHQEALVMLRKLGDARGLAEALELLGVASILNGDLIGSMRYYEEAKAIFEDLADRRGLALAFTRAPMMALNCLTDTVVPAATLSEAVWDGERALGIIREIGWRSEEVCALALLACCLGSRGELARALVLAQEGLALATELNHRQWQTLSHAVLGGLYFELLALPEAQRHLEAALVLAREIGSIYWIRVTTGLLSSVYVARADYAEAQALLNIPGLAMQTLGQRLLWCARAELALAQGEPHLALQLVERLLASAVNVSSVHAIPRLAKLRGEALAALSRLEEAEESFLAAGKGVLEQGAQAMLWRIQLPLGKLYLRQKRFKEAEQQFSAARALLGELATQLPDDLGSKFLNRAQAMLPSVPRSRLDRR